MISTPEAASAHPLRKTLRAAPRLLAWTIALIVAAPASAQAITTYSGASVGSNGTTYGWGVTDGYTGGMYHTAYVSTRLQSPNGRVANSYWRQGYDWVRADVFLPWDPNDLGTYFVYSDHQYYCPFVMMLFVLPGTQTLTILPRVVLSLRTGNANQVSLDNSKRGEYQFQLGTYNLGTFFSTGYSNQIWRTGVEVVGTVSPSSFTGAIILRRLIVASRTYNNTVELTVFRLDNVMDGYDPGIQDQDPQSGGSSGKVYDLDAPGIGTAINDPVGYIIRKRVNFKEWAELSNGTKVSGDLYWFSRLSVYKDQNGADQLKSDISADNAAGTGSTKITWNLQ